MVRISVILAGKETVVKRRGISATSQIKLQKGALPCTSDSGEGVGRGLRTEFVPLPTPPTPPPCLPGSLTPWLTETCKRISAQG